MHEKGIQKKKSISSIGRLTILSPIRYLSLNHHTPILVNQMSQTIKNRATIEEARINALKCLLNFIL